MSEKVIKIIEEVLGEQVPSVTFDLYELGADSLSAIKIVCYLEEEFKIRIEDVDLDIDNFENVVSIKKMLNKYV